MNGATHDMSLKYHSETESLLGPLTSLPEAVALLDRVERDSGFRFPASMREWYSIDGSCNILEEHSNADSPIAVERMLAPRADTNGGGPHNLLAQGLIPIRYENQGVAVWAVQLDGSDDPPVVVDVDTQFSVWRPFATSFSQYVYTCVWDYAKVFLQDAFMCTDNIPFDTSQLDFLRSEFTEVASTYGWPRQQTYRFCRDGQALVVWGDEVADWFLGAQTEEQLRSLVGTVGHLGSLRDYLYSHTDSGNRVIGGAEG